jgi:cell division protease FtsH
VSGARVVEVIESTPLEEGHGIAIESDILPVVRQVLGKVPGVIAAADGQLRLKRSGKKKKEEEEAEPAVSAAGGAGAGAGAALASFSSGGAGRAGDASFRQRPAAASASASASATPTTADADDDFVVLDDDTLRMVSRAVLGRTDVRDLIGRATAYDAAERARDILLDARTLERIRAVRRYVEDATAELGPGASGDSRSGAERGSAPFPPEPLAEDVPQPVYGAVWAPLEAWVRRARRGVATMEALDLLFTERQKELYAADHPLNVGKMTPLPGEEGWVDGGGAKEEGGGGGGGADEAAAPAAANKR